MNIAELFVSLGIKGADKTVAALGNVRKGLGELTSTSIEAKAAILAAVYGFERLMTISGQMGTNLTNFNALTGISASRLQEYQYAARQAGISNEEMAGSLKSVQAAMGGVTRGEGAPAGMKFISGFVGGFDTKKIQDVDYMMQKLQAFANNPNVSSVQKRWALSSFGLGEGVVAAMNRNMFRPDLMSKAPKYGPKEIASLTQAQTAWSNLGTKIEMAFGHFNARHGAQLVSDISKIVTQVLHLAEALDRVAEKLKIFSILGKTLGGITSFLESSVTYFGGTDKERREKSDEINKKLGNTSQNDFLKPFLDFISASIGAKTGPNLVEDKIKSAPNSIPSLKEDKYQIAPKMQPVAPSSSQQNNNVNQTFNFNHDGSDHKKTGDSVKKAVSDAYRQSHALVQGS